MKVPRLIPRRSRQQHEGNRVNRTGLTHGQLSLSTSSFFLLPSYIHYAALSSPDPGSIVTRQRRTFGITIALRTDCRKWLTLYGSANGWSR